MAFIGHYERTLDAKNRLQVPSQFRQAADAGEKGGWYVTLGERRHTLSLVTVAQFEAMCRLVQTKSIPGQDSLDFEQRFYSTTAYVDMDKQGRVVLPEYLTKMAQIEGEVILAGAKIRVDVWRKQDFEKLLGIDWEHDWPDWQRFLRGPADGPSEATD